MREKISSSLDLDLLMNSGLGSYQVAEADVANMGTQSDSVETICTSMTTDAGTLDTLATEFNSLIGLFGDGSWTGGYSDEFVNVLTKLHSTLVEVGPSVCSVAKWANGLSQSYVENDNNHKKNMC